MEAWIREAGNCSSRINLRTNMALVRTDIDMLYPNDIRMLGPRIDASGEATPMLEFSDYFVKFTDGATTGFTTNPATSVGAVYVKNATGADFTTGDWLIPNGNIWMFLFDGVEWSTLQGV